jgi:hypothetical protein
MDKEKHPKAAALARFVPDTIRIPQILEAPSDQD